MKPIQSWFPAAVLCAGVVLTFLMSTQTSRPLQAPLASSVPIQLEGFEGSDLEISKAEQAVAGMSQYLMRVYSASPATADKPAAGAFSVYVGYYENQTEGRSIHSPKNCLPGAGWEPLSSRETVIATSAGPVKINQYLIQNGKQQALVFYWYQGRGRIESNEYQVKWDLLRDAALKGHTEEALVRIVVPVSKGGEESFQLASRIAGTLIPAVERAIPS